MDLFEISHPPRGFYNKVKDWIEENYDKNSFPQYYNEFVYDEIVHLPKPKGIDTPHWNLKPTFKNPFTANIPNGRIWGGKKISPNVLMGEVLTPNNKFIKEIGWAAWWDFSSQDKMPPINYYFNSVAALAWAPQNNYYHWFFDILPRIELIRKSGVSVDKYVLKKIAYPFQMETLKKLGISGKDIIEIDNSSFHLFAKSLIVTSIPWVSGRCPKWTCDFVRNNFLNLKNRIKISGFEKIYISREDSSYRKIVNEDAVLQILEKRGFKKVVLRQFSLEEKIAIFASAKIIISPVDAGLSNLAFCSTNTKVIEFSSKPMSKICDVYWKISSYVNLDYYYFECDIEKPSKAKPEFDNFIVDINKFSRVLNIAGI